LLSTATTSSNVTPISPSVLRMFTRHDKGNSSRLTTIDICQFVFKSSLLNTRKLFLLGNKGFFLFFFN
jgi:hypothetical protein